VDKQSNVEARKILYAKKNATKEEMPKCRSGGKRVKDPNPQEIALPIKKHNKLKTD